MFTWTGGGGSRQNSTAVHEGVKGDQKVVKNCPRGIWMAPLVKMSDLKSHTVYKIKHKKP